MNTYEDWHWPMARPLGTQDHCPGAVMEELNGVNHGVVVVGYQDDDALAQGGYWIVKNSWGTGWGDSGYGYIRYGDLERHSRVHAITGDAHMPEPATLILMAGGGTWALLRRRRRGSWRWPIRLRLSQARRSDNSPVALGGTPRDCFAALPWRKHRTGLSFS